jgi:sec-independent protein translocase protein TatB
VLTLSPVKLLIVLVVAIILVGPDKLPRVAQQLGAGWRAFRQFHQRVEQEVRESLPDLPSTTEIARLARSPVAFLNQLADVPAAGTESAVPDPGAKDPSASVSDGQTNGAWPVDGAAPEPLAERLVPPAPATAPPDPGMN